jgi:hypothetical protein
LATPARDSDEVKSLKAFDTPQNDPNDKLNWSTAPAYGEEWTGVSWAKAGEGDYRVKEIVIEDAKLSGTLDLSSLKSLITLSVENNNFTSLDVSKNAALEKLSVADNKLTAVDVSRNALLEELNVGENNLSSLDVTHSPALKSLSVKKNKLTALDVSQNTALEALEVSGNKLPLSQLYPMTTMGFQALALGDQTGVIPPSWPLSPLVTGKAYDLSSEMTFNGVDTVFSLTLNGETATINKDYSLTNGLLVFHKAGDYQIIMENDEIHSGLSQDFRKASVQTEILKVASGGR